MYRPLAFATAAWTVAVLAALAGSLLPSDQERLSLALFSFAVGLGLLVAALLVGDGLRRRRARRHEAVAPAQRVLDRLEYVPSITTGAWRIHWRGARVRVMGEGPALSRTVPAELVGKAHEQLPVTDATELTASTS